MGYNTAVLVLNDAAHLLPEDPELGRKLLSAIRGSHHPPRPGRTVDVSVVNHVNAISVLPSEHADVMQIIALGGNTMRVLGHSNWAADDETILRDLARHLGYRLVKKS